MILWSLNKDTLSHLLGEHHMNKTFLSVNDGWSNMIQTKDISLCDLFLPTDGLPGTAPLALSPVLRTAQPLASLATPTTPSPAPVASLTVPSSTAAAAPETTSAAGGDEGHSKLDSPSEPDLPEPDAEPEAETDAETEEEKARRLLYCSLCKVAVNSASQLEAHNSGERRVPRFAANVESLSGWQTFFFLPQTWNKTTKVRLALLYEWGVYLLVVFFSVNTDSAWLFHSMLWNFHVSICVEIIFSVSQCFLWGRLLSAGFLQCSSVCLSLL